MPDWRITIAKKRMIAATVRDRAIEELAGKADHKTLAIWAADCAERVLPLFEARIPNDDRPRKAIEELRAWVRTGVFRMADVRGTSLAAHAAARETELFTPARSAARAAGQAMATAHVPRHALGAGIYATTAVRDSVTPSQAEPAILRERDWQLKHLAELIEKSRKQKK